MNTHSKAGLFRVELKSVFVSVCLCANNHLYGVYGVAEYFLQNSQIISVHGGNLSLFKLGGEPGTRERGDRFKQ